MDLQRKIYNFILEFWKLVKKYTPQPDDSDDKTWEELREESENLMKKHDDGSNEYKFFKAMVFAWFDYLNRRNKEQRNESRAKH